MLSISIKRLINLNGISLSLISSLSKNLSKLSVLFIGFKLFKSFVSKNSFSESIAKLRASVLEFKVFPAI